MSIDNVTERPPSIETEPGSLDSAANAILESWEDPETVSEDAQEATEDSTDETEVEESELTEDEEDEEETEVDEDPDSEEEETEEDDEDQESTDSEDDETETEEVVLDDDTLVEIAVDGETRQASIKDLKRLYGQEASLTRKSQETAATRKQAEESLAKADASLQAMLSRAQERWKPYSEVDMLVASRQLSAEDFSALRAEAKQAEDDLKFLNEEAEKFYDHARDQQQQQLKAAATECLKVLREDIPDWSNSLYNEIRSYAVSVGLPEENVNNIVDPNAIKLINKARLYDQTKKVATKKKAKAAKKVLRSKKAPPTKSEVKKESRRKAQDHLKQARTGDLDAAAAAIMANWES